MGKKPKPNWQPPATQEASLKEWTPLGFKSPYGAVDWTDNGYSLSADPAYDESAAYGQYGDIRSNLLNEFGLTGSDRAGQLDEYGQAFLDKSLEYAAPKLRALTYGRGQAGSRMSADAYADLVNKATTDSVLKREELRNLDEQLKLRQLGALESGLSNIAGREINKGNFLLGGVGTTEAAKQGSINNMRQYISDQNAIEAERYQRALESYSSSAGRAQAGLALAAAPFTGGSSLMMMPGDVGGGFDLSGMGGMFKQMGLFKPNVQTLSNAGIGQSSNPYQISGAMQNNPFMLVGR